MKWQMLILAVVGVVAAGAASVLVATMRSEGAASLVQKREVAVLLAKRDLAPSTVVQADVLETKVLTEDLAPEGALGDPIQAIGRVLSVPVVAGQALTKSVFAPEGSGQTIAANLPKGTRAVSVSLPDHSRLEGLLYPGSIVDVIVAFRRERENDPAMETISVTLLKAVQVLAVQDWTVGDKVSEDRTDKGSAAARITRRVVTLMVDTRQAEALQLAMRYGEITLALRNPHDDQIQSDRVTRLADLSGELRQFLRDENIRWGEEPAAAPSEPGAAPIASLGPVAAAMAADPGSPEGTPALPPEMAGEEDGETPTVEYWVTTLIKGGSTETRQFPMPRGRIER